MDTKVSLMIDLGVEKKESRLTQKECLYVAIRYHSASLETESLTESYMVL